VTIGNHFSHSFRSSHSHFDNGRHNGQFARAFDGKFDGKFNGPSTQRGQETNQTPPLQDPQKAGPVTGVPQFGNRYTVQQGDSLWGISDRMRAAGDSRGNWDIINEIARDNSIKNPDLIYPGQTFNLRGPMSADSFVPSKDPNSPIQSDGQRPGARDDGVAWIGQMKPAGADGDYQNAAQNCGPAVMAMLARKHGLAGQGMDDADLITALGKVGQTTDKGTTGNGLIAMADQMGIKSEAAPGANSSWVLSQLQQGKDVVANGDYWALPNHLDGGRDTSPHYILLTGIDANGNIKVEDPMDPNLRAITPDQLDMYTREHPEGGFNIAFG
jgi:LysM repeat protein